MSSLKEQVVQLAKPVIKKAEALELEPYLCPGGFPTVGWGHKLSSNSKDLNKFKPISLEEAERLLEGDIDKAYKQVLALTKKTLKAGQMAALVDFVFNLGSGNLKGSTLLKKILEDKYEEVPDEFRRWVYAEGVKLGGLIKRREEDIRLWNS